jgi:hypothetical protein
MRKPYRALVIVMALASPGCQGLLIHKDDSPGRQDREGGRTRRPGHGHLGDVGGRLRGEEMASMRTALGDSRASDSVAP